MEKNNGKQLRLGAVLSYISMIIGYVIQIAYTPVMIRIIGQSQYGLYNLTNSIVSYLSLFSLGFGTAYVRFYMRHKSENDKTAISKMNGMFMVVFLILGILATFTGMILVIHSDGVLGAKFTVSELSLAKKLMFLMVINIAISFPLIPIVSYIQANERFVFQNSLNILRQILNPFLSLPLLLLGFGSLGMIFATTVISMLIGVWQIIYSVRILSFKLDWHGLDFSELREVAVFSFFLFLNALTDQINWNIDKFIIGRYYGAIPVAIYGLAAQLNSYYLNLSTAISSVYVPRINMIVAKGAKNMNTVLTKMFITIGRVQFMIVVFVLIELAFLGRPFIGFWAGRSYYSAFPILMVLIVPVTIPLIQNTGIAIQQAKNMHIFRSILYIIIAFANALLSLILVKPYGALGTAFATAISLIIGNGLLMNWYYQKYIGIDIILFWKKICHFIPLVVVSSLAGFLSTHFINSYSVSGFLIVGVIIAIVYAIMLFLTGLDNDERGKVLSKLSGVFK